VLRPTTTVAKVSWLPPAGVLRLEQSTDLHSGSWDDSPLPVLTVGGQKVAFLTASPTADKGFYRLEGP
jgi:hypothetical protein